MNKFNVLRWDINAKALTAYDVLPYFRDCYMDTKKKDRPVSEEQWKKFVERHGMYMFWSRCEYEIIVTSWPKGDKEVKIDVWQQIKSNLDVVVKILMDEYGKKNVRSRRLVSSAVHSRENSST